MPRSAHVADLFDLPDATKPRHDPGGKVATPLSAGMIGKAEFYGDRDQYRLWLMRSWSHEAANLLWVGMNPSTARADVNDPTITREIGFTKLWGCGTMFKCNVMDYRATYQRDLLADGVIPRSDRNVDTILRLAESADKIIVCYGVLNKKLVHYGKETVDALFDAGHRGKMFCFGYTLFGHPKHPLMLPYETPLVPYRWKDPT